jgi:tRNA wybutosine-synthesizing protein 1
VTSYESAANHLADSAYLGEGTAKKKRGVLGTEVQQAHTVFFFPTFSAHSATLRVVCFLLLALSLIYIYIYTYMNICLLKMLALLLQLFVSLGLPLIAFLLYDRLAARNERAVVAKPASATPLLSAGTEQDDVVSFSQQVEAEFQKLHNCKTASAPVKSNAAVKFEKVVTAASGPPAVSIPTPASVRADGVNVSEKGATAPAAILIAYASQSQNSLALAHKLFSLLSAHLHTLHSSNDADAAVVCPEVRVLEMREEEAEDNRNGTVKDGAPNRVKSTNVCRVDTLLDANEYALIVFIASTYTDGLAPPRSQGFEALLKDAYEDHRVPRNSLSKKRFAVFGLGDIAYGEERFNTFAKHLHEWCRGLGAPAFVVPPVYATESKAQPLFRVFSTALLKWVSRAAFYADGSVTVKKKADTAPPSASSATTAGGSVTSRARLQKNKLKTVDGDGCACKAVSGDGSSSVNGCCQSDGQNVNANAENLYGDDDDDDDASSAGAGADDNEIDDMDDVEDLVWDGTGDSDFDASEDPNELPELLYPKLRQSLEKQGYRLIGSHSGVKLCRWTKSMLRGRGGCYKHTFYDINSSQCMEMTPSLACANKCVFCWRHHTNPISRHFRWKQDPPELLIAQGMAGHYQMIKQMRGVPGVTPERLATAMQIRHCALSLVGEPIMYPQINRFCDLLHEHHISTFMVTNAQFPEQLRNLKPVVQLYLSIDAPTPAELKRIDRPLFEDYWDRCLSCVKALAKKRQRTVFRLTLVNEYNVGNVKAYADLVAMGQPDFIEVKGVTYCGTSTSSTLTMKANVPRHDEVIGFCKALCEEMARRNPQYKTPQMYPEAAAATTTHRQKTELDFLTDPAVDVIVIPPEERDRPYHIACEHEHSCCVLIALDKFFFDQHWHTWINYEKFYELVESGRTDFTSLDYVAVTPTWATYKSKEKGFDPEQTRVTGKKARPTETDAVRS